MDAGPDSDAVYQDKLKLLAQTISDLGPDTVPLQEVGTSESFRDLQQALGGAYPARRARRVPTRAAPASAFSRGGGSFSRSRS